MTTALVWWATILAITWGLATAVRSRRWSPDQADPSELRTRDLGARLALIPLAVLLAGALLLSLSLLGWSSQPPGGLRLVESGPVLAGCAICGLGVVACLLTVSGRRVVSWWLLTGLLPALGGAAEQLGS